MACSLWSPFAIEEMLRTSFTWRMLLNLSVSDHSRSDSLLLSWDEPEGGAEGYSLALSSLGSGTLLQNGSAGPNTTSFWFHGLTPGTYYEIEVTATLACMDTARETVTAQTSPSPVRNLSLSSSGSSATLHASWEQASGQRDGYHLALYHGDSQTLVRNVSVLPNASTFLFDGLLAGSEYALKVSTLAGPSQASTSIHQWTAPSIPTQLRLSPGSSTSLLASWAGAGGAAWLHLVLRNLLTQMVTKTLSAKRGLTSYTFQHLHPGTQYWLGLSAVAGPYTVDGPNATAWTYPLAPSGVTLTNTRRPLGLSAFWDKAAGDVDQFHLQLYSKSHPMQRNISVGPNTHNFTFLGLSPGVQYFLKVTVLAGPYRSSSHFATEWTCGGRDHLVQLSVAESLSIIRNVSVPRGVTHLDLEGLVPGSRYRVEIISQAGPHRTSSQTAIGYTGREAAPLCVPDPLHVPVLVASLARGWGPKGAPGLDGYLLSLHEEGLSSPARNLEAGKDSTNITLGRLAPGTCYLVEIWAVAGPYRSLPRNTSGCTVPAAPTNLSLTNPGSSSELHAWWNKPPGRREHYRAVLYSLTTRSRERVQILSQDAQNITWTHLEAGSKFALQVFAVKGSFEASSTNITQWTYPLAPQNVYMTNQGYPNRLSVSWRAEPHGQDGYRLLLYYSGSGILAANTSVGKGISKFTFSGLAPGQKYLLEVVSMAGPYAASAENISDWTSKWWEPGVGRDAQPSPAGQAQLLNGSLPSRHALAKGQVQHLLQGLVPGRNYSVSLSCVAGPYWSSTKPLAVAVSFAEPNPVEDVQCLPESRSLFLNWTSSLGDVEAYEVVTEKLSDRPPASKYIVSVPTSTARLEGLDPDSLYRIIISTVGMNAVRSRAVPLLCNTTVEAGHPNRLCFLLPLPVEASSTVVISSDLFSEENGQIEYYGVVATTNDSLLRPTQETMSSTWYDHYYGTEDSYLAVLIPNPFHPSSRRSPETWRVPVGTEDCGQSRATCNGKLKSFTGSYFCPSFLFFIPAAQGVPQVSRLGCLSGCVAGLPDLPKAKASFPLDFISCRNVHRPIPIQNFKQYYEMKTASGNHAFFQEFEELKEVGKEQPKVEAELPANVSKNRYPHVLPYDHSRVKLSQLGEDPHTDYINANFVPGYTSQQEFIATQGPLKKTIEDFWRLVWEQNVCNIIMLTVCMENGRVLCDHYWPSESAPVSYGQVRVHLLAQSSSDEWTMREFKLWHGLRAERHVSHLHYTAWPDHGIPESTTSIMTFRELVRERIQSAKDAGPTLVHCSAGVGRSGTFIALDRLLQQMKQEKVVDTFGVVYTLRMNRYQMIQTLVRALLSLFPQAHSSPLPPVSLPRSCPIPLKSFAQHYAQNAAKSNTGFLREYEVSTVLGKVRGALPRPHALRGPGEDAQLGRAGWAVPPGSFSATFGTTGQCRAPCHPHQCSQPPLPHQSQLLCVSHGASHLLAWCLQLPPLVPCSGGVSQMGTLISLDCLLHQLKTERVLDVYGVTLQLTRSCCLMTPTLVGAAVCTAAASLETLPTGGGRTGADLSRASQLQSRL
uniref:protein-tyrosine-phosphatase n=1 Tax=Anas zonorhyncha TaxID=75864 RepID=A0A8B9UNQ9_9AVES